ncbi:MAG: phytanoyl-CoA dioxygenase family protein [Alphaproteobacteria bacterium]|nr:phytanoyl-CoA dioxygenase family protein [Alphaproteobacteria bacterium]
MTPEEVLSHPARVLSQRQRERYFADGYLLLEGAVPIDWVERLRRVTEEMVERSRANAKSDGVFDLEPGHSAAGPRLRRLTSPVSHHPVYWEFAAKSVLGDVVADLVGPDVKFHHSKLNFKWQEGGAEVKWHQDIQAWPHTNYSPLTLGTYLYDVGEEQGPLGIIPGSHDGPLYNHFNDKEQWVGHILPRDLAGIDLTRAVYLTGPAGSVTVHNCRSVHGSKPNLSNLGRPLLLNVYSAADAYTYSVNPIPSPYEGAIVRGRRARMVHLDPRPCPAPPDWSGGYTSLFAMQGEERWDAEQMATAQQQQRDRATAQAGRY